MDLLFLTTFLTTIGLFVLYKITLFVHANLILRRKFSNIPGPPSYPVIGTFQLLRKVRGRLEWFLSLLEKFKDGVFILWAGPFPNIYVYKPEFVQAIFSSTSHIDKGAHYDLLKPWVGDGIVTAAGEKWHKARRYLSPTFHTNVLMQYAVIMSEETEKIIKNLEEILIEEPTKAVNIVPFIKKVTFEILHETAMGVNIYDKEEKNKYMINIDRILDLYARRVHWPWLWVDWVYYLFHQGRQYNSIINSLHEYTNKVIQQKKLIRNMQNNESQDDSDAVDKPERKAILDLLLDISEIDSSLTEDFIRAQVDTFLYAGHDTTSTSIIWILFIIGNDLECQEKIHEELMAIFKDSQRPATVNDVAQLKYLDRVIKEARRLYPPVPIITRSIVKDFQLGNYVIPEGTTISIPILLLHRNPTIWPDPLKFDPDRFLPENSKNIHPYAYVPFSAGMRNCLGQKFALIEEKIIITAILRKWRVKSVEEPGDVTFHDYIILRRNPDEINIRFTPKRETLVRFTD